ncbi:MAG: hypothetical protein Q7U04_18195, partial [Bacteriovorax sp.]|nr:hypothetical protein [Bacteriovorax sp.]
MFKKITALLLLSAFTNVYAITPIQESNALANQLNKTFDSLNYKLNVEWNQKDSQFFDATVSDFEKEIADLQKDGVTNKDLIKYTTDKIKDKEIQNDITEMSKIISENQMSDQEARAFIISKLNSTYSHGASWSGSRMGVHTAVIIGAIILILICTHSSKTTTDHHPKDPRDP